MSKTKLRLDDFVPYRMSIASNVVSDVIASAYEALFGLKVPEWRLVAVLAETPDLTQQDLGARTRMDKVTVSRAAIALCERGLLVRSANSADKRSHLLRLSQTGQRLYREVVPAALSFEQELLADLTPEQIAAFVALLRKLEATALRITTSSAARNPGAD